ncbi:MAG TPA: AarF/ABC1/UbiB kinase family protein [Solirubrobacteraceae bacterium]|jgi:predicted unusual protein kinase regulating ubiquinone biosynthesis (AarF/ABC1/UbiB family)|nr:AarF/ABC1/UbiB kinase family protein [Solirubrobacteraceae bacterium]
MARENDKIPTSRARRTATVATLAATEAVKQFGTRAANVTRGEQASEEAMARRQLETAKQIVAVLGTMKGAAMKLGQVMSFLDVGLVSEEHRDEFQRELAKLRDAAPTVSFKQMRRVIEEDLEEPISKVFSSFEEEPIAAASIGQVYRATLADDGREVAVKVQYPGVAGAVRADLQNLEMLMRLLKRMTPGMDVKAIAEEIKERIAEELDYELEAQNQRALARIFAGHPFIVVPDVVSELSRERVLVSEFVTGFGFEELKGRSQAERDRLGEIIFRFFLGCLYRHRQFSGDPHPGNFLLQEDGRVAFLDFGLFKRMAPEAVELELACQRAVVEGDAQTLHELLASSGFLPEPERVDPDHLLAFIRDAIWWYTTADETVELTPEIATQVMIESSDPRSSHFREMRHQDMRPEHLFGRRMEMLTLAVLSQLRAAANWHRIAREWMYGDEPVTELGRAEAEFYGHSGVGTPR